MSDLFPSSQSTCIGQRILEVESFVLCNGVDVILRWELSRVKDTQFFLQQFEVPYCTIEFWSDRPSPSSDTFVLSQECEDEVDASLSRTNLSRLRQTLQNMYNQTIQNSEFVLSLISFSFLVYSTSA